MRRIWPKSLIQTNHNQGKVSHTCVRCRERHVKCSGGPVCTRCLGEGVVCQFTTSRRGLRSPYRQIPIRTPGPLTSATCVPCRQGHMKCSGTSPCTRCYGEGTICLFGPSHRGQRSTERLSVDATFDASKAKNSPSRSLSFVESTDPKATRSYHYFRERTARDLSGHNDEAFWTSLVMQISYHQPAIKHTLTALGSLAESLEIAYSTWHDEIAQPLHLFSLKQYGKAINLLKSGDTHLSAETILISCVLFVCFETLQKSYESAMSLLASGLELLAQWQSSSSGRNSPLQHDIVRAFSRASLQAKTFTEVAAAKTPIPSLRNISKTQTLVPTINIPPSFPDLRRAGACLETIIVHGYSIMDPVRLAPDYQLTSKLLVGFQALFHSWYAILNDYLGEHQDLSLQFRKEALYLKIQYFLACVMMPSPHNHAESRFDQRTKEFELIIRFAAEFLDLVTDWDNIVPFPDTEASRKCSLGIIPALYLCASRCRCPVIRRKAVDLLHLRNWRERTLSSFVLAKIAQWVIATEEQGLVEPQTCGEVPEANRIRILEFARIEEELVPSDIERPFRRKVDLIWYRPRAQVDLCFAKEPARVLIHYIKSPRDLTCPIEKAIVELE